MSDVDTESDVEVAHFSRSDWSLLPRHVVTDATNITGNIFVPLCERDEFEEQESEGTHVLISGRQNSVVLHINES